MSDPRRASDDLLIQLVREGRHDAEIAVRLGITTGELRERKAALRGKLGDEAYIRAVGAATAPRKSGPARRLLLGGLALAGLLLAVLLVIANIVVDDPEDEAATAPASASSPISGPTTVPPLRVTEDGTEFDDVGPFVLLAGPGGGTIGQVDNRAYLATVQLKGTAFLGGSPSADWRVISRSRTYTLVMGRIGDRRVDLMVASDTPRANVRILAAGVGPVLEVSTPENNRLPTLMLRATESGRPLEVRLTPEGHLLVAARTLDPALVFDEPSGALIDVSIARPFGTLSRNATNWAMNLCSNVPGEQVRCTVSWRRASRGFIAPAEGTFSCTGPRTLRYEADSFRLDFELSPAYAGATTFSCATEQIAAGKEVVPGGDWVVSAATADGTPLSIAVDAAGRVYVGPMTGDVSCPCIQGS